MKSFFIAAILSTLLILQPSHAGNKGVVEYFWFGCPHCYAFEPAINSWAEAKPDNVVLIREAPPLNRSWLPQSQAFYAAEIMGITEQIFEPLFTAIHKGKRQLRKPSQIIEFVGELGVDKALFEKTMNSFAVDVRIKRSLQLARAAGITGVPTVVVDGRYKLMADIKPADQLQVVTAERYKSSIHSRAKPVSSGRAHESDILLPRKKKNAVSYLSDICRATSINVNNNTGRIFCRQ